MTGTDTAREFHRIIGGKDGAHGPNTLHAMAMKALDDWERDAETWVREHGGLGAVKKMAAITLDVYQRLVDNNVGLEMLETDADTIDAMMAEIDEAIVKRGKERTTALALLAQSVPRVTYERHILKRQRQIDESHAALRRRNERIAELEHERGELYEMVRRLNAQTDEMEKRLMPEGMEWPRFEDGEPVPLGGEVTVTVHDEDGDFDRTLAIRSIKYKESGMVLEGTKNEMVVISHGERVRRSAPKVLDADRVEVELGDDLYSVESGLKFHVSHVDRANGKIATDAMFSIDKWADPSLFTHRAPVLAADGRPLREGETVWDTKGNGPYIIDAIEGDGVVLIKGNDLDYFGADFTHERPDSWERLEEDVAGASCPDVYCANHHIDASDASYEWAMARDIVRRARALAGVSE